MKVHVAIGLMMAALYVGQPEWLPLLSLALLATAFGIYGDPANGAKVRGKFECMARDEKVATVIGSVIGLGVLVWVVVIGFRGTL